MMFITPFRRCGHVKHINCVLAMTNNRQTYDRQFTDKGKCCKEIAQTEGKTVQPWPKHDPPPPAWRCECPGDPQPPNYDPYRIKVPDVVVPPLPPSNVKELLNEDSQFRNSMNCCGTQSVCDLFHNSPIIHPDYWKDRPERKLSDVVKDVLPKLGYHGRTKYKYAFHEPWKPLDRIGLLEQAEKDETGFREDMIKSDK